MQLELTSQRKPLPPPTLEFVRPAVALAPPSVEHVDFAVVAWSAWAPGVVGSAEWAHWALNPFAPTGPDRPELAHVAPLLRRRADRLARMALQYAFDVHAHADCPMIFASRYGEVARASSRFGGHYVDAPRPLRNVVVKPKRTRR